MFTPESLSRYKLDNEVAQQILEEPSRNVEILSWDPTDFEIPDSEQFVRIHRAPRSSFVDVTHFWIASWQIQAQNLALSLGEVPNDNKRATGVDIRKNGNLYLVTHTYSGVCELIQWSEFSGTSPTIPRSE